MASQLAPDEAAILQSQLSMAESDVDFINIADKLFASSLGLVTTRALLASLMATVGRRQDLDLWIAVGTHLLDILNASPTASNSFLEQSVAIRDLVAEAHEAKDNFRDAALLLSQIPLESSQRRVKDEEKARVWIRIVRNYLEVDDSTSAETYLNKLKNVIFNLQDPTLQLHFKLSQARINDAKRQFLAASQAYHEISLSSAIAEDEKIHTLSMAIKCAILAPAGPTRSRALGRLYKDERAYGLDEFAILENMFLDRLIDPTEVEKFAQGLQPHQLATTADGSTVLARAMVEHNLLAASRMYLNIGFDALGVLLGLDADKAEHTTARMMEQGRLSGTMDQLDRYIHFEHPRPIRPWDDHVLGVAEEVENVVGHMQKEFPAFVAQNLVT